jgi:hypothetical protein
MSFKEALETELIISANFALMINSLKINILYEFFQIFHLLH